VKKIYKIQFQVISVVCILSFYQCCIYNSDKLQTLPIYSHVNDSLELSTFAEVLSIAWRSDSLGYHRYRFQPITQFLVNYYKVSSTTKFDSCIIIFGKPDTIYTVLPFNDNKNDGKQIIWLKALYKGVYKMQTIEGKTSSGIDYVFSFNPNDSSLVNIKIDMGDLESSIELYGSPPK